MPFSLFIILLTISISFELLSVYWISVIASMGSTFKIQSKSPLVSSKIWAFSTFLWRPSNSKSLYLSSTLTASTYAYLSTYLGILSYSIPFNLNRSSRTYSLINFFIISYISLLSFLSVILPPYAIEPMIWSIACQGMSSFFCTSSRVFLRKVSDEERSASLNS